MNCTLTGIIFSIGTTGGTDKWIGALYSASGVLIASSPTAGITVGSANTKQKFAFNTPVAVTGPGSYFIALQSNGTIAKPLTMNNATEGFITGSTTGTFGTLPTLTPGSTYAPAIGPYASTY
jgi:hypothetical protein